MAEIACVIASTHNPRIFWNRDNANEQDLAELEEAFGVLRQGLAEAAPDAIVMVANDHLDNFFFDHLPSFAVGTGPVAEGPFWYESEIMHLPSYRCDVHQELAQDVLRMGAENGIQFSQVYEFRIDHAFTLPLSYVRPEQDIPLVPIISNAFGYPIPNTRRWYALGELILEVIRARPPGERIAVIGSFNLTVEVGGPKMGNYNQDFNRWVIEQMSNGAKDTILESLSVPRLIREGNSTAEFLNYVTVLGVVADRKPDFIRHKPVRGVGTCPVALWKGVT